MLKKKIAILPVLFTILIFVISGCSKTTSIVINAGNSITTEMSFAKDINPIFQKSCALGGCHAIGARAPDLTVDNSYNSLQNGKYITANDPDNSMIMLWLTGKKSPAMPLGSGTNTDINAKIYAWIKQGAKNN